MDPRQQAAAPISNTEMAARRVEAIKSIDTQKQTIQKLAKDLIRARFRVKKPDPGEKAKLYEDILGEDASVYHRPIPLEGQLANSKDDGVQILLAKLKRARAKLHYTLDAQFPRTNPPNNDLQWALFSFVVMPFVAFPLSFINPLLVGLVIIPPVFFVSRKIWRFFRDTPPRDFSLDAHGVTSEEYQFISNATKEELGIDALHHRKAASGVHAASSHGGHVPGSGGGGTPGHGFFDRSSSGGGEPKKRDGGYRPS